MLKTFLKEAADNGYVMNFHYSPEPHEIHISMSKLGVRPKFKSVTLPASYLSNDDMLVAEMRKLVDALEGKVNG